MGSYLNDIGSWSNMMNDHIGAADVVDEMDILTIGQTAMDMTFDMPPVQLEQGPWSHVPFVGEFGSDNVAPPHSITPQPYYNMGPHDGAANLNAPASASTVASATASNSASPPSSQDTNSTGPPVRPRGITIATAPSPHQNGGPSPSGAGPMSSTYSLPPRPKPGRKPATDEPQSKRKAQNRESQRAFRQRKAEKVAQLQQDNKDLQDQHQAELNQRQTEISRLKERIAQLSNDNIAITNECQYWKQQYDDLQHGPQHSQKVKATQKQALDPLVLHTPPANTFPQVFSVTNITYGENHPSTDSASPNTLIGCGNCQPSHCPCVDQIMATNEAYEPEVMDAVPLPRRFRAPPMQDVEMQAPENEMPTEIDFTVPKAKAPSFMPEVEHQSCGFCTDASNCLCKDAELRAHGETMSQDIIDESSQIVAATGPGTCDMCQADPKQKAWCLRLAQLRAEATPPTSRRGSSDSTGRAPSVLEPKILSRVDSFAQKSSPIPGLRSIGCSETYSLFDGRVPMDADRLEWRQLRPIPPQERPQDTPPSMEPGTYSAMEIDVGSILTTLQHSGTPLRPRASDGRNAPLIAEAEELRNAAMTDV